MSEDFDVYDEPDVEKIWINRARQKKKDIAECPKGGKPDGSRCDLHQVGDAGVAGGASPDGFWFDPWECRECGAEWDVDPLQKDSSQEEIRDYCIAVKSEIKRPERIAANVERQVKNIRTKKVTVTAGVVSERDEAARRARWILGQNRDATTERIHRICPPFQSPMGVGEINANNLLTRHLESDMLPNRSYHIRGEKECVIDAHRILAECPEKEWTNDTLELLTRLCLEMLLTLNLTVKRPWNLCSWMRRWGDTHPDYLRDIIEQGGPMSRYFGSLTIQHQNEGATYLTDGLEGFFENLLDFEIVTFNDDEKNEIVKNSKEILLGLDSGEKGRLNDRQASQVLYEEWCTIGTRDEDVREQTMFWTLVPVPNTKQKMKKCKKAGPMRLSSILLGLCVAQAISELYPLRRSSMRAVLENVVLNDLQWTGCVRDQIIWGWSGMMGRQDREPCTDLL